MQPLVKTKTKKQTVRNLTVRQIQLKQKDKKADINIP